MNPSDDDYRWRVTADAATRMQLSRRNIGASPTTAGVQYFWAEQTVSREEYLATLWQGRLRMKNRTHFAFRIDMWTDDGENIIEHLAGVGGLHRGAGDLQGRLRALAEGGDHPAPGRSRHRG